VKRRWFEPANLQIADSGDKHHGPLRKRRQPEVPKWPRAPSQWIRSGVTGRLRAHYFRRHQVIARLIADKGMPSPLPVPGWLRWDRPRFYAWLAGRAVPLAANDIAPALPAEDDIAAQRALLHEAYSRRAG
jgi:hypothetical protein